MTDTDWDRRFLELADHIAGWSKDPSRGVGAVIVRLGQGEHQAGRKRCCFFFFDFLSG